MGVIIPPGHAQVVHVIKNTQLARPMITTYGLAISAPGSQTMVNLLQTHFATAFDGMAFSAYSFDQTILRVGQDGGDPVVFESNSSPTVGISAAQPPPVNCSVLVKKITGLGGRRNRGRMYIPPFLPEDQVTAGGVIASGTHSGFQTAVNDWLAQVELTSGVENMVVLHSEAPATPAAVSALVVDSTLATQRRRMRG